MPRRPTPPRPASRALALVVAVALACPAAGAADAAAASGRGGPGPAIRLVQTRPVETRLGERDLAPSLETWLALIRGARATLDLEHFYCSDWPGEPLRPVLDALGDAAARGVRVRLLLDARMHRTYPRPADSLGRVPGIEVRVVDFARIAGGVQHGKMMIADGEVVFVGSQNLDWRALKHIHELGVLVRDRRVAAPFAAVFELDWAAADTSGRAAGRDTVAALRAALPDAGPGPSPVPLALARGDTVRVTPVFSPRGFLPDPARWDLPRLVALLDGARREIVVQTLQYGHGREERLALDDALRRAAARGVRVRLLVSDWVMGSRSVATLRALDSLATVEVRLSTLPAWSGGYIPFARVEHCKYAVVDGERLWIGTSNWEPGYFTASRNMGLVIEGRTLARQARRVFETSWRAPSAAPLRHDADYPPKVRGEQPPPGARAYGG
uniref:PLD phosphodiesterase domain-containing protein n=1 Tax=Eiseniibacteriota bacterium TaxID=2212470 RepID=A0A832MJU1_UNCEI